MQWSKAKGADAARLRQRKHELLRSLEISTRAIGGSLALTHRRCGNPNCRCASDKGHPQWSLTFMVDGKKRVEWIPADWIDEIQPLVESGRELKKAVAELMAINAQLLTLWRREKRGRAKRRAKT